VSRPAALVDRYPPYAAQVPANVKTIWISAGPQAWERGQRWQADGEPGLVLPPGHDPDGYTWPVKGFNVALIASDMSDSDVAAIVGALLAAGASVIAALFGPNNNTRMELIANGRNA
jgi:hypothetical protein